jgi:hypothetical protein
MLCQQLSDVAREGTFSGQPFVDHDGQGILVAGGLWFAANLLGCHVSQRAPNGLHAHRIAMAQGQSETKIAEEDVIIGTDEQVLRFEVAVNKLLIVRVVQGGGDLLNVGNNGGQGNALPLRVASAQGAAMSIFHHKIGSILL